MAAEDYTAENVLQRRFENFGLFLRWNKNRHKDSNMEIQEYIDTITELKAMISCLKLSIDTLRQTICSQNAMIASLQESMERLQCAYDKAVK